MLLLKGDWRTGLSFYWLIFEYFCKYYVVISTKGLSAFSLISVVFLVLILIDFYVGYER